MLCRLEFKGTDTAYNKKLKKYTVTAGGQAENQGERAQGNNPGSESDDVVIKDPGLAAPSSSAPSTAGVGEGDNKGKDLLVDEFEISSDDDVVIKEGM